MSRSATLSLPGSDREQSLGLWLGLVGVIVFGLTLPMTRLATGTADAPMLSPWFVTWGRAALAGALSVVYLVLTRSRLPTPEQGQSLGLAVLGNVIGYPLLLGWALRTVTASHAAVITALLPLVTAAAAAWLLHQRARLGFWGFALLGSALVAVYSLLRAHQLGHGFGLTPADLLLVGAVVAASLGYVAGAKVTPALGAERVISWMCVISMWAGFFAWFRGLALGGALRVSQMQLLQPFVSIVAAVPLLGESLDAMTLGFAVAVVCTVWLGKRSGAPKPAEAS
jgi:drug/metabolite transporter (DMT)-like permease